jgi:hypothetical protein
VHAFPLKIQQTRSVAPLFRPTIPTRSQCFSCLLPRVFLQSPPSGNLHFGTLRTYSRPCGNCSPRELQAHEGILNSSMPSSSCCHLTTTRIQTGCFQRVPAHLGRVAVYSLPICLFHALLSWGMSISWIISPALKSAFIFKRASKQGEVVARPSRKSLKSCYDVVRDGKLHDTGDRRLLILHLTNLLKIRCLIPQMEPIGGLLNPLGPLSTTIQF